MKLHPQYFYDVIDTQFSRLGSGVQVVTELFSNDFTGSTIIEARGTVYPKIGGDGVGISGHDRFRRPQ